MHFIEENPDGVPLSRDLVALGSFIRSHAEGSHWLNKPAFASASASHHEEEREVEVSNGFFFGRSTEVETHTVIRRRLSLRSADAFDLDDLRRRSFDLLVVKL
jgi:hypothetical protein